MHADPKTHHEAKEHHPKADGGTTNAEPIVVSTNFRAKVMDLETDGVNLFAEIDLTDGQTTLKLEPVFPKGTTADAVVEYMKELVELHPTLAPELQDLIGMALQKDSEDGQWYELRAGAVRKVLKSKSGKPHG